MSKHESTKRHASDSDTSDALVVHKKCRGAVKVVESDPRFTISNKRAYFCDTSDAHKYSRGSTAKVWFAHEASDGRVHRWCARVSDVVTKGCGCAVCDGKQVQCGINDVATTDERFTTSNNVAFFEDSADAYKYTRSSNIKVWFAHKANDERIHRWNAKISNVVVLGLGCAVCNGRQVQCGINDVATTDGHFTTSNKISFFEDTADAYKYTRCSAVKVWFAHTANDGQIHRWNAQVSDVVAEGHGCAVCNGRQVQLGINDVATTDKRFVTPNNDAFFENNTDAYKYTRGSAIKVWFAHKEDDGQVHRWFAQVYHVVAQKTGCPQCAARRGERLFCASLQKEMLKSAETTLVSTPITGMSSHSHKFDFLLHFRREGAKVRRFGGEHDGAHHFPNDGTVYGHKLRVDHVQQREIDRERNLMVDLMARIPSADLLNVDFNRMQGIADSLAIAAAKAFFAGESGLIMHPASKTLYLTTYSEDTVKSAVELFKRHADATQHFARN